MTALNVQPSPVASLGHTAASLADFAPKSILALGAEPQRALAVLIEPVEGIYRMVGWQTVEQPAQTSPSDCLAALAKAVSRLETQFNISLWDAEQDRPRLYTSDPAFADGVGQAVVVADLLPPLRVWMAGLSGGGSLAAGKEALAGALCNLVATYRPGPRQIAGDLAKELQTLGPDVVLIVGGYERAARHSQEQVLALSRHVADAAIQLPAGKRPLYCFAGSGQSAQEALAYWQARTDGGEAALADNVQARPTSRSDTALHRVLAQHHWQRSVNMPAMRKAAIWLHQPVELRSTQWAFVRAVRLWSWRHQLSTLHGLYASADRWLHVWASDAPSDAAWENPERMTAGSSQAGGGVRICYARPGERPDVLADWPPLRLVSGDWPTQWPRPSHHWWDPLGLVPVVAGAGQAAPEAAAQVLAADILQASGPELANV